jgi:hypothetical protein
MPDRDDYYERQDFYRQQDRAYENFQSDLEYERRRRELESQRGWEALRNDDTLGAIRAFGGADAAISYADRMNSWLPATSTDGYSLSTVKFYEGRQGAEPPADLGFKSQFVQSMTRFIYVLPAINNPWEAIDTEVTVSTEVGLFGESCPSRLDNTFMIYPSWRTFNCWFAYGWEEPGNWKVGLYQVDIFVNNEKIGDRLFSVNEP